MKERGIIFGAPMIRAIVAGTKTQTRRLVDSKLPTDAETRKAGADWGFSQAVADGVKMYSLNDYERLPKQPSAYDIIGSVGWVSDRGCKRTYRCPYGAPGDRLWVKETWRPRIAHGCAPGACDCADVYIEYLADESGMRFPESLIPDAWTMPKAATRGNVTPLFMPRWASRITLEITDVRVERLQSISESDARAEGVKTGEMLPAMINGERGQVMIFSPIQAYAVLWDSINGKTAPWSSNPWCWCLTFRRLP